MPKLTRTRDNADVMAQATRELGHTCELKQCRRVVPNPSPAGSSCYPSNYRSQQISNFDNGVPISVSVSSVYNWKSRLHSYRQTGNKDRSNIVGVELLLLCDYILAYPNATQDEIATFIFNEEYLQPTYCQSALG